MDLLEVLGLSPPSDDNAVCFEVYQAPPTDGELCALTAQVSADACCGCCPSSPAALLPPLLLLTCFVLHAEASDVELNTLSA